MAQLMTPYQGWLLSIQNAIQADQPLPIPEGSPPLTREQRSLWELHVKQAIHTDTPITPYQWLQAQEAKRSSPTPNQPWADLLAHRLGQQAPGED